MSIKKKLLALLLAFIMLVGMLPTVAFADGSDAVYLAFTSDVHHGSSGWGWGGSSGVTGAGRLGSWLNGVSSHLGGIIFDSMGFCGDTGNGSAGEADYWKYVQEVIDVVEGNSHVKEAYLTAGNHEYINGRLGSTTNPTAAKIKVIGEAVETDSYIIYCFGASQQNDMFTDPNINILREYLKNEYDSDKPIFILSHFPLHTYSSRTTANADKVIDLLNSYPKAVFLWGHNHTLSDPSYDKIFTSGSTLTYAAGKTKEINFTYCAAGCMSDSEYSSASQSIKGKGLVAKIEDNEIELKYYDVSYASLNPEPDDPVIPGVVPVGGKQYVIIADDGYALSAEAGIGYSNGDSSQQFNYNGLIGVPYVSGMNITDDMLWTFTACDGGYYISNGGKYLNGNYVANSTGGYDGTLALDDVPDIWTISGRMLKSANASTSPRGDKFLTHGNGGDSSKNLFSVRSEENASTLRYYEADNGEIVVPEAPEVPGTTNHEINITANGASTNKTIKVGDTLTINLTNGSSPTLITYTSTVEYDNIAKIISGDPLDIEGGQTGKIVVQGINAGVTKITCSGKSSASGNEYKATITLTVTGSDTPDEPDTTDHEIDITSSSSGTSVSKTIKVGDTLTINLKNGSSYNAKTFTNTVADETIAKIISGNSLDIGAGQTGKIVVKGLKAGNTTISCTGTSSSGSTYYATITLTVTGSDTPDEPEDPVEGTVFKQVSEFTNGKEYLIVAKSTNSGTFYALTNNGGSGNGTSMDRTEVTVIDDTYIVTEATNIVWKATANGEGYNLTNNGDYLEGKGGSVKIYSSNQYPDRYWTYVGGKLQHKGGTNTYTVYYSSGNFTSSNSTVNNTVLLFEKVEADQPCTHSYGEWVVTKEASCTEAGEETRTCSICGEPETRSIEATGHTEEIDEAVAPTCTEAGLTEGKHCSVCGEVITAQQEVPALGHSPGEPVKENEVPATETEDGSYEEVVYCTVCEEEISRERKIIPATGGTEPECSHNYGDWVVTKEANCTEAGEETRTCSICGKPDTRSIEAKGHIEEIDEAKEPTCTEAGLTEGKHCSVCGEVITAQQEVPALGHSPGEPVKENEVAATETKEGSYDEVVYCTVCNEELSREKKTIPATGGSGGGGGGGGAIYYTLTFNTNGGSAIDSLSRSSGTKVDLSAYVPTKDGFVFEGWYADEALTEKITSVDLNKNTTVYAKWSKKADNLKPPFTDINDGDWFYNDVKYVYEKGLMMGTSDTSFSPDITTSRGMIVTILYRLDGEPAVTGDCPFDDVASGMYYEKAIIWAVSNGIVSGYSNNKFGPNDNITREQMVTILYRYAIYKGYDVSVGEDTNILSFADASDISSYAFPAFQWALDSGIIYGTSTTTLSPRGNLTRAQAAAILHRFCELFE